MQASFLNPNQVIQGREAAEAPSLVELLELIWNQTEEASDGGINLPSGPVSENDLLTAVFGDDEEDKARAADQIADQLVRMREIALVIAHNCEVAAQALEEETGLDIDFSATSEEEEEEGKEEN